MVSTGPSPAAIATTASGNTIRMPKTAMTMPQVRKRRCQTSSMSLSTVALTTALSNDSEISSTDSTITIHTSDRVPETLPVTDQPYHTASARQTAVNSIEPL